jgi:hypothetical protein
MSDYDENNNGSEGSEESEKQVTNESQQTLTLDGKVYAMSALPAEAINVLNDLIRSENELNEHRFRIRTLTAAQQGLTAALNQFIAAAGIEPMPAADSDQDNDSQSDGEG